MVRSGHNVRYAIVAGKIITTLGWHPADAFEAEMRKAAERHLGNEEWCRRVRHGTCRRDQVGLAGEMGK